MHEFLKVCAWLFKLLDSGDLFLRRLVKAVTATSALLGTHPRMQKPNAENADQPGDLILPSPAD